MFALTKLLLLMGSLRPGKEVPHSKSLLKLHSWEFLSFPDPQSSVPGFPPSSAARTSLYCPAALQRARHWGTSIAGVGKRKNPFTLMCLCLLLLEKAHVEETQGEVLPVGVSRSAVVQQFPAGWEPGWEQQRMGDEIPSAGTEPGEGSAGSSGCRGAPVPGQEGWVTDG